VKKNLVQAYRVVHAASTGNDGKRGRIGARHYRFDKRMQSLEG
jgi:hypothetical protein